MLSDKYLFYSYWDTQGKGINPQHLKDHKESLIFDSYNRVIYGDGVMVAGNHYEGSYHGEIFNDYAGNNKALGDYSSASGSSVTSYNAYEFGVGHHNLSRANETIFTIGNGTPTNPKNAFEVHKDNASYVNGNLNVAETTYLKGDLYSQRTAYMLGSSYFRGPLVAENSAYFEKDSYTKGVGYFGDAYVGDLSLKSAYAYTMSYIGAYMGRAQFNVVKTVGMGQYYIWVGTVDELPAEKDRYSNIIYIVLDENPSMKGKFTDIDYDSLIYTDNDGLGGEMILMADDGDRDDTNDPVLRHDGIKSPSIY